MEINNNSITNIYLGSSAVTKVYLGPAQVYPSTTPSSAAVANYGDGILYSISEDKLYRVSNPEISAVTKNDFVPVGVVINPNGTAVGLKWVSPYNPDSGSSHYRTMWGPINNEVPFVTTTNNFNVAKLDMAGKKNSDMVLVCATAQTNWKTDSVIIPSGTSEAITDAYYPLIESAWRYHTSGTSQGDWYIPAVGEIYEAIENHNNEIWQSLARMASIWNVSNVDSLTTYGIATSTQADGDKVWAHISSSGWVTTDKCWVGFYGNIEGSRPVFDASSVERYVFPSSSANKTLVVTSVEEATNTGMYRGCLIDNIFDFVSDYFIF